MYASENGAGAPSTFLEGNMKQANLTRRGVLAGTAATGALAALSLSGCGGGGGETDGGSTGGEATAAEAITAALGNTSTNVNPVGLNGGSALMLAATWHVFEGLYEIDFHDYSTYNALAAGDPVQVTETQYEVTLREGAMFSDGNPVTAADVKNAFEANMADATCGPFISFVDTVEAKDDTTVVFNLKYPFANLLKARLGLVKVYPASLTDEQLTTQPIGSGPWMYESVNGNEGGTISFVPNPNYNGSKPATCQRMDWNILVDGTSRTTALTDGSALAINDVPDANADQVTASGCTVEYVPGFNQPFIMFNCKKAPFDDVRVRQAIFYAIDVDKLISNQMAGHAAPVTSFLSENVSPNNYHRASTVYTYDPDKAKSLLEEAGVTDLSFTLDVNNTFVQDLAPQIKEDLAAIGVNCELAVQQINWAEYAPTDGVLEYDAMLTGGDPTCFGNDPDLLMTWWYGDNLWTQGRSCWKGTPEFDELQTLMQQAREESDATAQQELWNQCFDIIAENVPLYALFHRETATGYNAEKIDGFSAIPTTGLMFLGATPLA